MLIIPVILFMSSLFGFGLCSTTVVPGNKCYKENEVRSVYVPDGSKIKQSNALVIGGADYTCIVAMLYDTMVATLAKSTCELHLPQGSLMLHENLATLQSKFAIVAQKTSSDKFFVEKSPNAEYCSIVKLVPDDMVIEDYNCGNRLQYFCQYKMQYNCVWDAIMEKSLIFSAIDGKSMISYKFTMFQGNDFGQPKNCTEKLDPVEVSKNISECIRIHDAYALEADWSEWSHCSDKCTDVDMEPPFQSRHKKVSSHCVQEWPELKGFVLFNNRTCNTNVMCPKRTTIASISEISFSNDSEATVLFSQSTTVNKGQQIHGGEKEDSTGPKKPSQIVVIVAVVAAILVLILLVPMSIAVVMLVNSYRKNKKDRKMKQAAKMEELKKELVLTEHTIPIEELYKKLETNIHQGLTSQEAAKRLAKDGPNALTPPPQTPWYLQLAQDVFGGFQILIWIGAMLCLIAYIIESKTNENAHKDNLFLGLVLAGVALITGFFQYYQEASSSKILETFKNMVPPKAKVKRDGQFHVVEAKVLVVGDVVEVNPGDRTPADVRVVDCFGLKVDNSSLTGECDPQSRQPDVSHKNPLESENLIFFSTSIVEGRGVGVVILTGDRTVMGRIAGLASGLTHGETPIGKDIRSFINYITVISVTVGIALLIMSLAVGEPWLNVVLVLIDLFVAHVPEGLLATVTVCLTLTAKRMAARECLVKDLQVVETLGAISTICTDKTGTLTQSRMTVTHLWFDDICVTAEFNDAHRVFGEKANVMPTYMALMQIAALCNGADFKPDQANTPIWRQEYIGDARDQALLKYADRAIGNIGDWRARNKKICEIPFNSSNKFQVSIHLNADPKDKRYILVMKGAPERILKICSTILSNGQEYPLNDQWKEKVQKVYDHLGGQGERLLGFCDYVLPGNQFPPGFEFSSDPPNFPLKDLRFVGLISLVAPPYPAVLGAVAKCRTAGIRVVMVTGDHPLTASAIARQVGIISDDSILANDIAKEKKIDVLKVDHRLAHAIIIEGDKLSEMKQEEIVAVVTHYAEIVFARTSPQQKLVIVETFQKLGEIVAVTGDGVNDSPALKAADIGIAMGISGSEVSKEAASMILLDDNFATIVAGVEQGRLIFDNLKKSIAYTLTSKVPALASFLFYAAFGFPLALSTTAILCIDLGTDMIPAISLAYETAEAGIMRRQPRNPTTEALVNRRLVSLAYGQIGVMQACAGFFAYFVVMAENGFYPQILFQYRYEWDNKFVDDLMDSFGQQWPYSRRRALQHSVHSAFFFAVVVCKWATLLATKVRRGSFIQHGILNNKVLLVSLVFETLLAAVLINVPGLNVAMQFFHLRFSWWFLAMPVAILIFVFDETRRLLIRKYPGGAVEEETYF